MDINEWKQSWGPLSNFRKGKLKFGSTPIILYKV